MARRAVVDFAALGLGLGGSATLTVDDPAWPLSAETFPDTRVEVTLSLRDVQTHLRSVFSRPLTDPEIELILFRIRAIGDGFLRSLLRVLDYVTCHTGLDGTDVEHLKAQVFSEASVGRDILDLAAYVCNAVEDDWALQDDEGKRRYVGIVKYILSAKLVTPRPRHE